MFRRNWRDREFWAWWWGTALSPRLRSGAAIGSFILLGAAGTYSALRLSSANEIGPKNVTVWETIVARSGPAHTQAVRPRAGRVRVVVHYVSKKSRDNKGEGAVVNATRVVTEHAVVTRTVSAERTVTRVIPRLATRTVTRQTPLTTPAVTVTAPAVTQTQTETLPAQTVVVTVTVKQHGH